MPRISSLLKAALAAVSLIGVAPPTKAATVTVQLSGAGFSGSVVQDPVEASLSERGRRGPTDLIDIGFASADLTTATLKTRVSESGGSSSFRGLASARLEDVSWYTVPTVEGETHIAQVFFDVFVDPFAVDFPLREFPGGSPSAGFSGTLVLMGERRNSTLEDFARVDFNHTTSYGIQLTNGLVSRVDAAHRYRQSISGTDTFVPGDINPIGIPQITFSRLPSTVGFAAVLELPYEAYSGIRYSMLQTLTTTAAGAYAHGITADASRSMYFGIEMPDGAQFLPEDPLFLSAVSSIDLRERGIIVARDAPAPVPLPAAVWGLLGGLSLLAGFRCRRSKAPQA